MASRTVASGRECQTCRDRERERVIEQTPRGQTRRIEWDRIVSVRNPFVTARGPGFKRKAGKYAAVVSQDRDVRAF